MVIQTIIQNRAHKLRYGPLRARQCIAHFFNFNIELIVAWNVVNDAIRMCQVGI